MTELYDYERYGLPVKKGEHYFYSTTRPSEPVGPVRPRQPDGEPRQLIDPNGWSKDGATALAEWTPSEDGKLLAYSVQDGGTDWRTRQGDGRRHRQDPADELKWLKYSAGSPGRRTAAASSIRAIPARPAAATFQNATLNHRVYFHKLGTRAGRRPPDLCDAGQPEAQPLCAGQRRRPLAGHLDERGGRRE